MSKASGKQSFKRVGDYAKLLKLPQWQKVRLKVLEYADFRCQLCGNGEETLHVHHSYYTKGKKPWEYPLGSMIAICETHHDMIHKLMKAPAPPLAAPKLIEVPAGPKRSELPVSPEAAAMHFAAMRAALQKKKDVA